MFINVYIAFNITVQDQTVRSFSNTDGDNHQHCSSTEHGDEKHKIKDIADYHKQLITHLN